MAGASGPRALPWIGGMLQLRGDPLARIRALRAAHGGFVRLGPLRDRTIYLVTDPDAVRHVLLDHQKRYRKGLAAQRLRPVLGQGSLLLEGDPWRRRRRLIQPGFHRTKIVTVAAAFVAGADEMLERWRPAIASGTPVDARDEMLRLTMALTIRNLFGAEPAALQSLVDAWQHLYAELSRRRLAVLPLPSWIPSRRRDAAAAARATVHRVLGELIRARTAVDDGSVLAMLVRARDDGEGGDGGGLGEDELRDEVMTLFVGGYETSSNALAFTLATVAGDRALTARLRAESDQALAGRAPGLGDLTALPLHRAVIDETLRRYPPSWMITREALTDDVVAGHQVARGDQLLISAYGLHHAPELWPEPDAFRPERFLPGAPERPRFAYLPFGGGPRACVGDQYALTEMHLVLARLIQRVDLALEPGGRVEAQAHVGLRPRFPLRLRVRDRATSPT